MFNCPEKAFAFSNLAASVAKGYGRRRPVRQGSSDRRFGTDCGLPTTHLLHNNLLKNTN
jgi:hypothetical protein